MAGFRAAADFRFTRLLTTAATVVAIISTITPATAARHRVTVVAAGIMAARAGDAAA